MLTKLTSELRALASQYVYWIEIKLEHSFVVVDVVF